MMGIDATSAETIEARPNVLRTTRIGGFPTIVTTASDLAARMVGDCFTARAARLDRRPMVPKLIFSSNGQGISLAARNEAFATAMGEADMVHADGMSVVLASRFVSATPLPERIATTDFFHDAARAATSAGLNFYFLGGSERQIDAARAAVARLYPALSVVGCRDGYFSQDEEERICADIVAAGTDVLWVGLGKPAQEHWSVRNRARLVGVGWVKTCGGLYAFLGGEAVRAPRLMQRLGLEWAWRVLQEPRRLAWRYAVTNPHALYLMFRSRDLARSRRSR